MTEIIVAIVGTLGFVMAAAGVIGSWRGSRNTTALSVYRETALAWQGKSRVQETEIADLHHQIADRDTRIERMATQLSVLQDVVTGKASLETLERKVGEALNLAADTRTEVRLMHENQDKILAKLGER